MFAYPVFNQVRALVASLSKKTFKSINYELKDLIQTYGEDARLFFFRCLVEDIEFHENKSTKEHLKLQLLNQELEEILNKPNFISLICRSLDMSRVTDSFLNKFSRNLKLPLSHQAAVAIAITHSEDQKAATEGRKFLMGKLPELAESSQDKLSESTLHEVVYFIQSHKDITGAQKEQHLKSLKAIYPQIEGMLHIQPILPSNVASNQPEQKLEPALRSKLSQVSLANVMRDLGYDSLESKETFKKVIEQFPRVLPDDVAKVISMMAQTTSGLTSKTNSIDLVQMLQIANRKTGESLEKEGKSKLTEWNIDVFVSTLTEMYPRNIWPNAYKKFDHPGFFVPDKKGFNIIHDIYNKATSGSPFPVDPMLQEWENRVGQVSYIKNALLATEGTGFFSISNRIQASVAFSDNESKKMSSWRSLDLIESLILLGDTDQYNAVWDIFKTVLTKEPELVLCGVLQLRHKLNSAISQELVSILLPKFLRDHPKTAPFLSHLWKEYRQTLVDGMTKLYLQDTRFTPKAYDILKGFGGLEDILKSQQFDFAIELACLSASRDTLNLESWLKSHISLHKEPFVSACLEYLHTNTKLTRQQDKKEGERGMLSSEVTLIFNCLFEATNAMSQQSAQELQRLYNSANPKQADTNSSDIEDEAHLLSQQIYEEKISLDEVIEMLKKFKSSSNPREVEIFAVMIHNLFDEYRFFYKYPVKELRITGILFGLLIKHRLVSSFTLGYALRYVFDALRNKADSRMFRFGMWALEQFKERLHQWPQYCAHIIKIPHLQANYPELVAHIERVANENGQNVAANAENSTDPKRQSAASRGPSMPPIKLPEGEGGRWGTQKPDDPVTFTKDQPKKANVKKTERGFGGAVSLDTLTSVNKIALTEPPANVKDKIMFAFNNLSERTLKAKVAEVKDVLQPQFFGYFSRYLVVERVTIENNHLKLYAQFLDEYNDKSLHKTIVNTTYENVKLLISSDKVVDSSQERTLLKNLGSWLGLMTLARNKPILAKKLVLKDLVIDAYSNGRLIAIIPFVAKVLEPSSMSKIFKPPNPWLMAILALLREIFELENLKLNLKFEIEVLFNNLQIKMKDVEPTVIVSGLSINGKNLRPEKKGDKKFPSGEGFPPTGTSGGSAQPQSSQPGGEGDESETNLQYVKIHPTITLFQAHPQLKRCVPIAVDRAIRDIISPVVERSVTIACVTSRELIMKDFATEPDHNKIRQAAHQMVQKLTSSLALVTCKEPLRVSISNNLASLLETSLSSENIPAPDRSVEHACVQVSADNLDFGCKLVEKAASDRAVHEIDDILAPFYNSRKRQGQYYPPNSNSGLPEALRPKAGGILSPVQMRVYHDFGSVNVHAPVKAEATNEVREEYGPSAGTRPVPSTSGYDSHQQGQGEPRPTDAAAEMTQGQLTNQQVLDNLLNCLLNLQKAVAVCIEHKEVPLSSLPKTAKAQDVHKIVSLFSTILRAAREETLFPPDVMYLTFANKVFKELYANDIALLGISSLCAVLKCVVAVYPSSVDRITEWVLAGNDQERVFVKPVITALVANMLVDARYLDAYLRKIVIDNLPAQGDQPQTRSRELDRCIDLSMTLISQLVLEEQVLPPETFRNVIEVLLRLPKSITAPFEHSIQILFENLAVLRPEISSKITPHLDPSKREMKSNPDPQVFKVHDLPAPLEDPEHKGLRQQVYYVLDDWLTICLEGTVSDKTYAQYLSHLQQQGVLQTTKSTNLFFRLITELCIEAAYNSKSQNQSNGISYTTINALAKLVVFLVKFLDNANKIALLSAFLQVAAHVLICDHDSKTQFKAPVNEFNQKPYLRLFTNLLYDLNTPDPSLDSSNMEVLNAFSHCFHTLRPARVPGFAFAWMELISHRMFMPKLLISKPHRCSVMFKTLIVDQLTFLQPYLQNAELLDQVRLLYTGTLRILLVLLHDFPEFLCEFHFSFCDAIPTTCIQMRNLILSAFPRNMRLPDPFTPHLKVDLLPEISHPPRIGCNVTEALIQHNVLRALDQYLSNRLPTSFHVKLCEKLMHQGQDGKYGSKYDVRLINSVILHVGMQGIAKLQTKNDSGIVSQFQDNACMDIFERLVANLDPEGRYYVLNAIANQLRYPNNHTHYFSCVLLYLFLQSKDTFIKEQITRVLLERLIVHRPHPWGLLITFIELIKNPQYEFWKQPFTNCAPEIEQLFESVARSCMPSKGESAIHMPYSLDKEKMGR